MFYSKTENRLFSKLDTPKKVQDFLNTLKINFEKNGETCRSPRRVIKAREAHCMEGAMLAAAVFEFHGQKPWVMDLRSVDSDEDHVVAVFRLKGFYGAVSKTNHAVLRYREPVYRTLRELALSYFHEYFDQRGRKTLREYSRLFDLRFFDRNSKFINSQGNWRISPVELFEIPNILDTIKHFALLSNQQEKFLRRADKIEIKAGEIVEFARPE
jgi:hypothetical protein